MSYRLLTVVSAVTIAACASTGSGGAAMAPTTGFRLPPPPACPGVRYLEAKNPSGYQVTLTLIGADGLMRQMSPAMLPNETRRYGLSPRDSVVTIRASAVNVSSGSFLAGHQFDVNVSPHWACDSTSVRRPD